MSTLPFPGWLHCPYCPEEDALWPPSCWDERRGCCRACAASVRVPCVGCGKRMQTLAHVAEPRCHGRRRERLGLRRTKPKGAPRTAYWREYKREQRQAA